MESNTDEVVTDNGVCYAVTDKGLQMLADNADATDQDDLASLQLLQPVVIRASDADHPGDVDTAENVPHEDVPSILVPAHLVFDTKRK